MSDFGLDSFALADLESSRTSDPLKIARDLIAAGKPRSALDVVAEHHPHLADDPEYLILCAQAWQMVGDLPRAQHALVGAIRVSPEDPEALQQLGELLVLRGEDARAKLAFARAADLRRSSAPPAKRPISTEEKDDLIAVAQSRAHSHALPFSRKTILLLIAVLFGIGLLMSAIAALLEPDPGTPMAPTIDPTAEVLNKDEAIARLDATPAEVAERPSEPSPVGRESPSAEALPEVPTLTDADPPRRSASLLEVSPTSTTSAPVPTKAEPRRSRTSSQASRRRAKSPSPKLTEEELDRELAASTDPIDLTARADRYYARGQGGVAATYYRRALELDPDYAPALVGSGRGLLRAERYDEVMVSATRALELARGVDSRRGLEAEAIYQLGRVHHERGEEETARKLLRQATSLPGVPAAAWFYLGEALAQSNSQAAREAYERYLKRRPKGQLASRARRAIR